MGSTHSSYPLSILRVLQSLHLITADLFCNKHRNEADEKRDQSKDAHGDNFRG